MESNYLFLLMAGIVMTGFLSCFLDDGEWDLNSVEPPWGTRPSIFEHIKTHSADGEDGDKLPDDAEVFGENAIRWVSGGMDGVLNHHASGDNEQDVAEKVLRQVKLVFKNPTQAHVSKLYETLKDSRSIGIVDPLLELTIKDDGIDAERLHDLAVWLATKAADREPVKVALSWLGVLRGYDDGEIILTLARHDEFTLYASVAIANREENPENTLWQIAKHVDGWSRIQTVEMLAETTDPDIKNWLLREGYKNTIMYEYLAYTCATAGDLHGSLLADQIDDSLLLAAGDIIQTLIIGQSGPAEGIDDYEHGAVVTQHYIRHLNGRADSLEQFLVFKTIEGFLSDDDEDWSQRSKRGWTSEARKSMLAAIEDLVDDEKWRGMVQANLRSEDRRIFDTAAEAARQLGIDTWNEYYTRTVNGQDYWFHLMQTEDRSRIEKVVQLAEAQIPLSEIATGPSDELGLGDEFNHHSKLDFILQDLGGFPGLGWTLIKTGLRSPVVRNRNMGIRALARWTQENWPEDAKEYVEKCRNDEPDDEVREAFIKLLAGEPLDF